MLRAPLVVGYKGEIGRYLLACLLEEMPKANDIFCTDVNNPREDVLERIDKSDFIFLCVPLHVTVEWLIEYKAALRGKTVVEQSSLKAPIFEHPELQGLEFLSMHLLFRPSATPPNERRGLVFADHMPGVAVEDFRAFAERAFKTPMRTLKGDAEPTYRLHDKHMAREQGLVHRVILSLAKSLDEAATRTVVGQRVCDLAERILAGDPVLYRMIQENPYLGLEVEEFQGRLARFQA